MNAISTLGLVIGANGAAAIWEYLDIRIALGLTGLMAALGGLALNLLPRDPRLARTPARSPV